MKSNTIGTMQLKKNRLNRNARLSGVTYVFWMDAHMQRSVSTVMIETKTYLQRIKGPQAYLNEMYGYALPRNSKLMPQ